MPVGGTGFFGGLPFGGSFGDQLALCEDGKLAVGIFHAIGQGPLGQQNLTGLGHGGKRDADKGGQTLGAEHLLQKFRSSSGAAEDQRRKLHLLVMGQIGGGGIQIAAVAGQLLGSHGKQLLRGTVLGIGGAAESIKINRRPASQAFTEILPLANIIAQLPGQ